MLRQRVPLKKSADGQTEKAGAPTKKKTRWTASNAMGTLVVVIVSISAPFAHPLLDTAATASRSPVSMPWPRSYHFLKRIRDQACVSSKGVREDHASLRRSTMCGACAGSWKTWATEDARERGDVDAEMLSVAPAAAAPAASDVEAVDGAESFALLAKR